MRKRNPGSPVIINQQTNRVPKPAAVPKQVDQDGPELIAPQPQDPAQGPTPTMDLARQQADVYVKGLGDDQVTAAWVDAFRTLLLLGLMHLNLPTTIRAFAHTINAEEWLQQAIDAISKMEKAIRDQEPRAFEEVDLGDVKAQKSLMVLYIEVFKILLVAVQCVEAGVTHFEQYLDGAARNVYKHVSDLINSDRIVKQELWPLYQLVMAPVDKALHTKATVTKLLEDAAAAAAANAGTGETPAGTPTATPAGSTPGATGGTPTGRPPVPPSTPAPPQPPKSTPRRRTPAKPAAKPATRPAKKKSTSMPKTTPLGKRIK